MQIFPFFSEKPWAGNYINTFYKLLDKPKYGEAFILSTLKDCESTVDSSPLSLKLGRELPFLIKIIDAKDPLSLQVHPNDYWAQVLENSVGKTECWLILDAEINSGVYYGFKEGHNFNTMIDIINEDGDASKCLNFLQVKKGDFIEVPAGTIHAIGPGVRILEFQQSSGITYRIWDWNRPGRELHLEKAEKVIIQSYLNKEILEFSKMGLGKLFFSHDDFFLTKVSDYKILCSSNRNDYEFEIDTQSLQCIKK